MAIHAENLSFGYSRDAVVLRQVTLDVPPNSVTAVLGPSGCGKSTLLRLIAGLLPSAPTHHLVGRIMFRGDKTLRAMREAGLIGFVSQASSLLPYLSTIDNITLPLRIVGRPPVEADALLDAIGLTDAREKYPAQLSTGMQLRAALARAFITGPELLLLDEPFSTLDLAWKIELYREFNAVRRQQRCTCVVVTHDVTEAVLLADELIVMTSRGQTSRTIAIPGPRPTAFKMSEIRAYLHASAALIADVQATVLEALQPGDPF